MAPQTVGLNKVCCGDFGSWLAARDRRNERKPVLLDGQS